MNIPKDLLTYSRNRVLRRVIPFAVLLIAYITAMLLWRDIFFLTDDKAVHISCSVLIIAFLFVFTGVPHKLIDRTYCGTVKKVDIVTSADNDTMPKYTREHLYLKNTVYLTVELSNGKTMYKKAYSGRVSYGQQKLQTYQVGDTVFHLYGTDAVIVLPNPNDTEVHCAVCDTSNSVEKTHCRNCNHSLVKKI